MPDFSYLPQIALSGIGVGCIYGLIGIGFCVIYNASGIVNFAPVTLSLPEDVSVVGVDLAIELEQIAFSVANRYRSR